VLGHEGGERCDRARLGNDVRVRREHQLARSRRDAGVDVRRERAWLGVLEHTDALRNRAEASGEVGDHDELVDLRRQGRQRLLELPRVPVGDDDGRDRHDADNTSR
jgi:hypothetical protein